MAGSLMDLLDSTIVNVALPTIQRDLHASGTALQWISAAYLLTFAVVLITAGRLGDVYGRKRVFLAAVTVFGVASLCCGLAQNPAELIAFRATAGLAAAGIAPQVLSTLQATFHGKERGIMFGLFNMVGGLAQALGVTLGGVLTSANLAGLGWRTIFFVNVPVAALLVAFGTWTVPETRQPGATLPAPLAVGVLTAGLIAIVFPLLEGRALGWPAWCWLCLAAGVAAVAGLAIAGARRGSGSRAALLPVALFRARSFTTGLIIFLLFMASLNGFLLVFTLWLQDGEGFTPLHAGLVTIAFSAGTLLTGVPAGRLTARFGRLVIMTGCAVFALGAIVVLAAARTTSHGISPWSVVPGLLVLGAGLSLIMVPLVSVVMSTVPPAVAGAASGIWSTTQQFGGALGVAVLGAIFFTLLAAGGYTAAFTAGAATVAVTLACSAALCLSLPGAARD
jgi:EmrB/QacA subfamily drug resistance transporter